MEEEQRPVIHEDEIDLVELIKVIWSRRLFIIKVTFVFFVFGFFIAFTSKVEYKSTCMLMPESQNGVSPELGGLGGLAGLAGIKFDMASGGSLTPDLYPEIVRSSVFIEKLINTPVYFEKIDKTMSSFDYFKDFDQPVLIELIFDYTVGLPSKLWASFMASPQKTIKDYGLIRFSKEDWGIFQSYADRLFVSVESQTGIITIETEMPDPVAAAITANLLVKGLTESVINYKVEKAEINLQFIQDRFYEAKDEYETNQSALAIFTDRNRNISNSIIQTEYERLQNQMNISFEVYKGLATQLEQAKIQVKEETPVFTVLEPVKIPVQKSKPKRILIVILSSFIGVFFSITYLTIKELVFNGSE